MGSPLISRGSASKMVGFVLMTKGLGVLVMKGLGFGLNFGLLVVR